MEDVVELEFRDGKRWVPNHLAIAMSGLETFRYTYEEALQEANNDGVRRYVDKALDNVLNAHFRRMR